LSGIIATQGIFINFALQNSLHPMLKSMLIAGIGGFIGSCGRYFVSRITADWITTPFPAGTFAVNLLGCFAIGILYGLFQRTNTLPQSLNALLIAGFCGGFTTFSTFSNEVLLLIQAKQWLCCTLYLILSIVLGVLMVWIGRLITQQLF